ncbi:hypothetical protein CHS0354_004907 [Potamilus streckersoni]|uniref:Uncharacterized protein n=1 Tax=Potamilus streckersoni TaxID=2493646 RepID=A0AAE0WDF9_9BIVA|nr:hypothetical protein CHS0354_004907 [Potamilus streckersoni]
MFPSVETGSRAGVLVESLATQVMPSSAEELEVYRMKDFRRPTLSVIHEGGSEPNSPAPFSCNNDTDFQNSRFIFKNVDKDGKDINDNVNVINTSDLSNDLARLKATASKLNLRTRRSSYMLWKDRYIESNSRVEKPTFSESPDAATHNSKETWTEERINKINNALEWLRNELLAMRSQDQDLARQFLSIRHDIHQLKLQKSCEEHKEMLEDITQDIEEAHELDRICDFSLPDSVNESPLRQIGVTRMNLSSRRFSTC